MQSLAGRLRQADLFMPKRPKHRLARTAESLRISATCYATESEKPFGGRVTSTIVRLQQETEMTLRHRTACLLCLASLAILASSGCGAYVVEGGLYPLPTIHLVDPQPSEVGLEYANVQLTAESGQTMYAWFIPAENARATVLFHHGALGNRAGCLNHARLLHDLGCNVFVYDYQGFGESWALATLNTLLPDAGVALEYIQVRNETDGLPIILFGTSLGTLPTFAQAAETPRGVVGVVAEGSMVPETLPTNLFFLLGINPGPEAFLDIPHDLDPEVNVPLITLPKLFIHSRSDTATPFASVQQLYDAALDPKELQEVSGDHLAAITMDTARYRSIWSAYLDELLGPQTP